MQSNASAENEPLFSDPGNRPGVVEGHYIVVLSKSPAYKNPRVETALESLSKEIGSMAGARINRTYMNSITGFAAELSKGQVERLQKNPNVLYVTADRYVYPDNDFSVQEYPTWGLDRIDQRESLLDYAYSYTGTGKGVTAYVVDTGIFLEHPEFENRASFGEDFSGECTDEPFVHGHGTHVAGTIGGSIYGVAKDVKLVDVKVFGCEPTTDATIVAAVDWITLNADGPSIVNMSLSRHSPEGDESPIEDAIETSIDKGIHYVVSSGNTAPTYPDACERIPAKYSQVLTVGASTIGSSRASFSTYGECVDLFAPGVNITSAWITDEYSGDGSFTRSLNGTSMAAPHVAGVAALYLETNPEISAAELHSVILENTTPNAISDVPSGTNNLVHSLWEELDFTVPPPPEIYLTANGKKVRGSHVIDLSWSSSVPELYLNIYRDNSLVAQSFPDMDSYSDNTGVKGNDATYVHQVCKLFYDNCSNKTTTIYGDGGGEDDGEESNEPPTADFTYQADGLTVQFTDASTDSDGTIESWNWDFGDGNSSTSQNPLHSYSESGTYSVSLTVTDNDGDTGSASKNVSVSDGDPVPPGEITLSAEGYKVQGRWRADLSWTPSGTSENVDVYRDGSVIATTQNDGSYTDATNFRGGGALTYKVCEAGTDTCSNEVTVEF